MFINQVIDKVMTNRINRRSKQKEETRQRILTIAARQFAEQGFAKTTIRSIANEAGIAVGTLFVHFEDKSALLAATLYDIISQQTEQAFATRPENASVKEVLLHIATTLYTYYAQDVTLSRTLLKEILFMDGDWGEAHNQQAEDFVNTLAKWLQTAQEKGDLPGNANPMMVATSFFAHYLFILITGLRQPTFDVNAQIALLDALISPTLE